MLPSFVLVNIYLKILWVVVSNIFGIFIPKIGGRWTHCDEHIVQRGWFSHQPEILYSPHLIYEMSSTFSQGHLLTQLRVMMDDTPDSKNGYPSTTVWHHGLNCWTWDATGTIHGCYMQFPCSRRESFKIRNPLVNSQRFRSSRRVRERSNRSNRVLRKIVREKTHRKKNVRFGVIRHIRIRCHVRVCVPNIDLPA